MEPNFSIYVFVFSIFWTFVATGAYISAARSNKYRLGRPFFILRGVRTRETTASEKAWNQAHQGISRVYKRGAIIFAGLVLISFLSILDVLPASLSLVAAVVSVIVLVVDAIVFRKRAVQRAIAASTDND